MLLNLLLVCLLGANTCTSSSSDIEIGCDTGCEYCWVDDCCGGSEGRDGEGRDGNGSNGDCSKDVGANTCTSSSSDVEIGCETGCEFGKCDG